MPLADHVRDAFKAIRDLRLDHQRDVIRLNTRVTDLHAELDSARADIYRRLADERDLSLTELRDVVTAISDLNNRMRLVEARLDARPTPETPPQLDGAAEGAMSHVTRPVDDDASEWEDARHRAYRGGA